MVRRHMPAVLAVAVVALAAAGCGSEDDNGSAGKPQTAKHEHYTKNDLKRFAVQSSDLPAGYKKTRDDSWSAERCLQAKTREEAAFNSRLKAWGLEACAGVTYRKETHNGDDERSNEVFSGSWAFRHPDSAAQALPVIRKAVISSARASGDAHIISRHSFAASGLGDETARGARIRLSLLGETHTMFLHFWRARNVVVSVGTGGWIGDLSEHSLLEIAKRLDYRATRE